jgi:SPP1 gp7 family putative phage head morphogenesis protein
MTREKSPAQQFADLFKLTPKQAVEYLQGRDQLTRTYSWQDLWHEEHTQQFTVSRMARMDILKAMQDGITASVQGDMSRRDWMRDMKALLKKEGWWGEIPVIDEFTGKAVTTRFDSPRLKLIFDTNTRQAYAAGQWQRIVDNKESRPYIRYITRRDGRVRAQHQRWDNLVLPVDDPFWQTRFPPNGYRCRCRVTSVSQAEYDKGYSEYRGEYEYNPDGTIKRIPGVERIPFNKVAPPDDLRTFVNQRTGAVSEVPAGVMPGFDFNPGMARAERLRQVAADKVAALPAPLALAAEASIKPVVAAPQAESIGRFLDLKRGGVAKRALDVAVPAIDKVHDISGLPSVPVMSSTSSAFQGQYSYKGSNHDPVHIKVSSHSKNPGLTALHEIGHFIDHQSINGKRGFASPFDPLLEKWRSAVDASAATAELSGEMVSTKIQHVRKACGYYLRREEQWARAYAQYIATRSADPLLLEQLDAIRTSAHAVYRASQWSDDDFAAIGAAIDDLLTTLGLKR